MAVDQDTAEVTEAHLQDPTNLTVVGSMVHPVEELVGIVVVETGIVQLLATGIWMLHQMMTFEVLAEFQWFPSSF